MNTIDAGKSVLAGNVIQSGRILTTHAMVGETLSVDQMTLEIVNDAYPFIPADWDGPLVTADNHAYFCLPVNMREIRPGRSFAVRSDGDLLGRFWTDSIRHRGGSRWRISALSVVGQFLSSRHMGGIYDGVPASEVYAEILKGVTYDLDPDVAAATVSGYLPIAVRRDNLQQLLMATGATLRVGETGRLTISAMSPVTAGIIGASRCYIGGSVEESTPVTGVQVTEHNYFPGGDVVTLFEGGVDGEKIVEFSEPYHSLELTAGTIVESSVNFARISATGTVTLTGKPYTHVTHIVSAGNVSSTSANIKTVSRCTLANPQIAQALAERVYSFLRCSKTIKVDTVLGTERAGDVVKIFNPYTRVMEQGTIKSQSIDLSATNKATVECLVGFVPSGVISGFTGYALLTGSGTWTVPDGVVKIRIILVAGGTGGGGGHRGMAGTDSSEDNPGIGGNGGAAGEAGSGGKIFEIALDVTPGETFDYVCGAGGKGGAGQTADADAEEGGEGAPTVFGGYSSDYGRLYPYGYAEAKTGKTLAAAGAEGFAGGKGGDGVEYRNYGNGETGESVNGYSGGKGGKFYTDEIHERSYTDYTAAGGGGAANGAAGGSVGTKTASASGGDGATGSPGADSTSYGQGGGAGNGGGGGGGAGTIHKYVLGDTTYYTAKGGTPGNGSDGGKGGPGAVIIYY